MECLGKFLTSDAGLSSLAVVVVVLGETEDCSDKGGSCSNMDQTPATITT